MKYRRGFFNGYPELLKVSKGTPQEWVIKVVWNFQGIADISNILVQIYDRISIGGVKIPSRICENSRGEDKKRWGPPHWGRGFRLIM